MSDKIRWGILSTAHIAQSAFLPALRVAGGEAYAVAGRSKDRTEAFARANGIENALAGYSELLHDPNVVAVYNPLPNSLHAEWTIKALESGKAVLCEKPLCGSLRQAASVLEAARRATKPAWEAFVFPFHLQQRRLEELVVSGAIGDVREIHSEFFFRLTSRKNIRLSPELGGGAINDIGCYPVRFSQLLWAAGPTSAVAMSRWSPEGVDEETQGVLEYEGGHRLVFTCGMTRDSGTFTRLLGDEGEIRITNPFHARAFDFIEIARRRPVGSAASADNVSVERLGTDEPTFAEAIRHIHAVLREEVEPAHTVVDDSLVTEVGLDVLHRTARSGQVEHAVYA